MNRSTLLLLPILWAQPLYGYEFLREFVSSDWSTLRTTSIQPSDLIARPTWLSATEPSSASTRTPISWAVCESIVVDTDGDGSFEFGPLLLSDQIPITLRPNSVTVNDLIQTLGKATGRWNTAASSSSKLLFEAMTDPNNHKVSACRCSRDSVFGVFCRSPAAPSGSTQELLFIFNDHFWAEAAAANDTYDSVLAFTNLEQRVSTNLLQIRSAVITVNPQASSSSIYFWVGGAAETQPIGAQCPSSCVDLQGIITHELGHALGIAHSRVSDDREDEITVTDPTNRTQATMYPFIQLQGDSVAIRSLELDDATAFRVLYDPSNSALTSSATVSGIVSSVSGTPLRGASVTIFDADLERTILSAFSGVTGGYSPHDGSYEIRGVPVNEPIVVFVEPITSDPLAKASTYNSVIQTISDQEEIGLLSFNIESDGDYAFPNVRTARTLGSFDLSSVQQRTLTATNPLALNFFVSQSAEAPNDTEELQFSPVVAATTDRTRGVDAIEYEFSLVNPPGLFMLDPASLSIQIWKPRMTEPVDISATFSAFDPSENSATFVIPAREFTRDGTYTVTATVGISEEYTGRYEGTSFEDRFTILDPGGIQYGGGFSCAVDGSAPGSDPWLFWIPILLLLAARARRMDARTDWDTRATKKRGATL